jgi:short-subunit dehydrogenase involved in D-alanine esterification of teichoic acids
MQPLKINVASHVALNPVPEHPVYTLQALQHFFPANLKSSLEAKNVSFEKKDVGLYE